MKRFLLLLLVSGLLVPEAGAQDRNLAAIPVKAGRHLQANYPDAIVEDWLLTPTDRIKAVFLMEWTDTLYAAAYYTQEGDWIETRESLSPRDLPRTILVQAGDYCQACRITLSVRSTFPDQTERYTLVLQEGPKTYALQFEQDDNGDLLLAGR